MKKAMFLSLTVFVVALAGCTDEPPSGNFQATEPAADYSAAGITVDVTPASNDYPADDPSGTASSCQLDDATGNDPTGTTPTCEEAYTEVAMTPEGGATLPATGEGTPYELLILNGNGVETLLGELEDHGEGHYDFPAQTFDEDYSDATEVQIRYGETIVATAPGAGGNFELAEGLQNVTVGVNFVGATIDVSVVDAPNGTPLVAWLVDIDEEGTKTHGPQFILAGDITSYTLTEEEGLVGDYEEFHVHVGNSAINVAVAQIPGPVDE